MARKKYGVVTKVELAEKFISDLIFGDDYKIEDTQKIYDGKYDLTNCRWINGGKRFSTKRDAEKLKNAILNYGYYLNGKNNETFSKMPIVFLTDI